MFSMTNMPPLIVQSICYQGTHEGILDSMFTQMLMGMKFTLSKTILNDTYKNVSWSEGSSHFEIVRIPTDFSDHVKTLNRRKQERKKQQEQWFHIEEIHKEWGNVGDFQVECGVIILDLFQEYIGKALWSPPLGTLSCSSYHKQMPAGKQGSP